MRGCGKSGAGNIVSDIFHEVDEEVRRITDECYADARRILKENRNKLDAIVKQLLLHETLDEPDVYAAAGVPTPPKTAEAAANKVAARTVPHG